ncbi:MAG: heme o synthase [Limisphaerales bacterium]|jgi:protoheme IX farnesyltransferase
MNPKATSSSLDRGAASARGWVAIVCDLTKARLTLLVLLTTLVGFYLGTSGATDYARLFHTMLATALLAGGAAALNQLLEREYDARMRRTATRPLPAGELTPETVLLFGGVCSVGGLLYLALAVNYLTCILGAVTLLTYLFLYTPLKRVTWLNTAVGAIPGAIPPLMGWTAASGQLSPEGWTLFGILALWQLPHFFAIAWLYRDEYARAGFVMLPAVDADGSRTGAQAVSHTLALLGVSMLPFLFKLAGPVYLGGALLLGVAYAAFAFRFARALSLTAARQLFYSSIIYLPLLLTLLVGDKLK